MSDDAIEITEERLANLKRLAPKMPDQIEFEPGKFANYDPDRRCWYHRDPETGEENIIRI